MNGLLSGQVKLMFDTPSNSAPQIAGGRVRALAIMGSERIKVLSDVPTTTELGMPALHFTNWLALYAPTGTPQTIVQRLIEGLKPAMQEADMKAFFDRSGLSHNTPFGEALGAFSRAERKALSDLVKKAGIPLID
jgi:tripartite-type tricarboxylate transporter receptor subunit TctC